MYMGAGHNSAFYSVSQANKWLKTAETTTAIIITRMAHSSAHTSAKVADPRNCYCETNVG